jgi:hypothetical protein
MHPGTVARAVLRAEYGLILGFWLNLAISDLFGSSVLRMLFNEVPEVL